MKLRDLKILGMIIWLANLHLIAAQIAFSNETKSSQNDAFVYDDQGKRNPFLPLVSPEGLIINYEETISAADMLLEGIVVGSDGKNIAIINGLIVNVNDKIGPFVIKMIEPDVVIIQEGLETFSLMLKKEE